jgi:hypothetical protein
VNANWVCFFDKRRIEQVPMQVEEIRCHLCLEIARHGLIYFVKQDEPIFL